MASCSWLPGLVIVTLGLALAWVITADRDATYFTQIMCAIALNRPLRKASTSMRNGRRYVRRGEVLLAALKIKSQDCKLSELFAEGFGCTGV
jgi:hypothetical protein